MGGTNKHGKYSIARSKKGKGTHGATQHSEMPPKWISPQKPPNMAKSNIREANISIKHRSKQAYVDIVFCPPEPRKSKNNIFSPWGHEDIQNDMAQSFGRQSTRSTFLAKMTKMPLVNLRLTENQTRSKPSQNNTFHNFTSSLRFLATLTKFDRV